MEDEIGMPPVALATNSFVDPGENVLLLSRELKVQQAAADFQIFLCNSTYSSSCDSSQTYQR